MRQCEGKKQQRPWNLTKTCSVLDFPSVMPQHGANHVTWGTYMSSSIIQGALAPVLQFTVAITLHSVSKVPRIEPSRQQALSTSRYY